MTTRSSVSCRAFVIAFAVLLLAQMAAAQTLYFGRNYQEVWTCATDGSGLVQIYTYPDFPIIDDIAYDGLNGRLYLAVEQQGPGFNVQSIDRMNTNGSGHVQLVNLGTQFALAVTYNPAEDKIYWLEQGTTRQIRRADSDGSNAETVLTDSDAAFRQIRIHIADQQIYWTDASDPTASNTGSLRRAPVGTGVSATVVWPSIGSNTLEAFDFSFSTGEVFWTQRTSNEIQKANIDGTGMVATILSGAAAGTNLEDIVVDRTNNRIFWSDGGTGGIYSAALDGSGKATVVASGAGPGLAISNPDLPVVLQRFEVE